MAPSNVALVVFDTVRKDTFDEHFDWLPGKRFENAYSTANWTGPAHASLFTGKYGSEVGVDSKHQRMNCRKPTLAERLSEVGYATRGWSANPNVSPVVGFDRGFEEFVDVIGLQYPHRNIANVEQLAAKYADQPKIRRYLNVAWDCLVSEYDTFYSLKQGFYRARGKDPETDVSDDGASTVLEFVRSTEFGNREFLFVNLMEAHTPYFVPEHCDEFDEPVHMGFGDAYNGVENPDEIRRGYDISVEYLSSVYREIFEELRSDFEYVFTLSDHGELLGEHHDMWSHVSGIYPELTHVPLVVSGEDVTGTAETAVSLLDVHRTIGEITGVELDSRGRNLLGNLESREYIAEYKGPFAESLEKARDRGMNFDQYDRELNALIGPNGYYGYEDYDGWYERGDPHVDRPRERLDELEARLDEPDVSQDSAGASPELMGRLEDLGYV